MRPATITTIVLWQCDCGSLDVGPEWNDVRIRRDGWPDQRYKRGREMVAHFTAACRDLAEEAWDDAWDEEK